MLTGIVHGFQLVPANADLQPAEMDNFRSATDPAIRVQVESILLEETAAGNYMAATEKLVIVGALGAILKPDSNEVHLIHDCSQPEGKGLNTYADIDNFSFQTLEDAVKLLGPGYFMAKVDICHAYRSVPIHPGNYRATGLKWQFGHNCQFTYLMDIRLAFRGRQALGIFHRVSQSVKCMMVCRGYHLLVVNLADFLIIGATRQECQEAYECLLQLLLPYQLAWSYSASNFPWY